MKKGAYAKGVRLLFHVAPAPFTHTLYKGIYFLHKIIILLSLVNIPREKDSWNLDLLLSFKLYKDEV
jgi:hypothetical protein